MTIVLKPEAIEDLAEAARYYESRQAGLGHELIGEIDAAFRRIEQKPSGYRKIHGELRRSIVRRFPFCVYYLTDADAHVTIYAVVHQRRSPAVWQKRYQP